MAELRGCSDYNTIVADVNVEAGRSAFLWAGVGLNLELRALLLPSVPMTESNPVPFFMQEGKKLSRDVSPGTVITQDMIIPPEDSFLWSLRKQQDEYFSIF